MARILTNAFNAGELTPDLMGRVDLESLKKACRVCRNFLPRTLGGVRRRPGMLYLGEAKYNTKQCRLLPFNFSTISRFVLELGDGYIRFWKDGSLVLSGGVPLELAAPWTEAQLFGIQMVQVNNLIFFTHPSFHPQELRRVSDTSWTLADFAWNWPAMRDLNDTTGTMTCSVTTGSGTLTSSVAHFTNENIGSYYQITHRRAVATEQLPLTATATTTALRVLGAWELYTFGKWTGDLFLEIQKVDGTWQTLRSWGADKDNNIQANGTVDDETSMRMRYVAGSHTGTPDPRAELAAIDPSIHGLVKVTGVTSSTVANVTVIKALEATTATLDWAEGAWSTRRGYPRACAIHQQRLTFAGNAAEPQKIWGSAINDFNNFQLLEFEDSSYAVQVAAQEANPIVWLASQEGLIVGTEGDEWLLDSGDSVISPTNPPYSKRKTKFGSADLQAQLVGSVVLFVQRGRRALREYVFAFDEQGYKAPDLTQLSEHMTKSGFKQFGYAQNPDSIIWAVTNDGMLLSCTYRRESEVVAWAQHPTSGFVESVCTIYGANDADEVWFSVLREIDGVTKRFIERFDPTHWQLVDNGAEDRASLIYLDSAIRQERAIPPLIVTGLSHLEGAVVSVIVEGAEQAPRKVIGGQITLDYDETPNGGEYVIVGLSYMSRIQPFLSDLQLQDGTAQGLQHRTPELRVRLHLSGAMSTGDSDVGPFRPFLFRNPNPTMDAAVPLFTGLTEPIYHQAGFLDGTNFEIRTDSAQPLNILMVVAHTGIYAR
jgi:hypothetical protein